LQIAYFEIAVLKLSDSCFHNLVSGDDARVVLKKLGNDSDYINASFVNVSESNLLLQLSII